MIELPLAKENNCRTCGIALPKQKKTCSYCTLMQQIKNKHGVKEKNPYTIATEEYRLAQRRKLKMRR